MARVIKAGAGQKPTRAPARVVLGAGSKKLIGRELYQAKQDAEHILMRAEQQRHQALADGKRQAAQAREEAMARGASEAFAAAATEALGAFRSRAQRYAEAAEDIRALALEVVKKVLGTEPDLGPKDIDMILSRGLAQLRARRRLRLQVNAARLAALAHERPNLMKALVSEPDLVMESADDVNAGFARVVTEIGGALCAEETALDALARAVNVRETPRTQPAQAGQTAIAARPSSTSLDTGKSRDARRPDPRLAEIDDEENGRTDDIERTIDLRKEKRPPRDDPSSDEEIPEIEAQEDESRTEARPQLAAHVRASRPATRVVPLSEQVRRREDEDLDLFTDDAVPPKKRR